MNTETMRDRFERDMLCGDSIDDSTEYTKKCFDFIQEEISRAESIAVAKEREENIAIIESFELISMKTEYSGIVEALNTIMYPIVKEKLITTIKKHSPSSQ